MKNKLFDSIKEEDIVIDCGAYLGRMSNYFLDKGAIVWAVEPCPILQVELEKRLRHYKYFRLVKGAASDATGDYTKLFYHSMFPRYKKDKKRKYKFLESSSLFDAKLNVGDTFAIVSTVDLSFVINMMPKKVKLLKLNIEGAEYKVLNKLIDSGVLERKVENVVVSFHARKIPSLKKEHNLLKKKVKDKGLENIIHWKWWVKNKSFLMSIKKEFLNG